MGPESGELGPDLRLKYGTGIRDWVPLSDSSYLEVSGGDGVGNKPKRPDGRGPQPTDATSGQVGPARFGSYRKRRVMFYVSVSTAQAAYRPPASEAVTVVTAYCSSSIIFWTSRDCAGAFRRWRRSH
jgi:hypothetical protein